MESVALLATSNTLCNVVSALGRTISSTTSLRGVQWEGNLAILSLVNQLSSLRTALGQLQEWIEQSSRMPFGFPTLHHQLVMDLDRCIVCCRLLITKIDADVGQLQRIAAPSKFTVFLKTRNLKEMQTMVQQQTTALTLLLTACNSAAISQQKMLLENSQTRGVFKTMEDNASSLLVHRGSASIASSSSSMVSSNSSFGGGSILSLRFDFDKQIFMSKIYDRWIRATAKNSPRQRQQSETGKKKMATPLVEDETNVKFLADRNPVGMVETRGKFTVLPQVISDEKHLVDESNIPVETREKFTILPQVISDEKHLVDESNIPVETREKFITSPAGTSEKFTLDEDSSAPIETRDKFITDDMAESPYSTINDEPDGTSSLAILLRPKRTNSFRDKWKPLQRLVPFHEKSDSEKRSLAIDNALKEESKNRRHHDYKTLLIGSESRLLILAAARMRDRKKNYGRQELDKYRDVIFNHVRHCTRLVINEMRRAKINPGARYIWAYVDIIEGYLHDEDQDNRLRPAEEMDYRFFDALEAIVQVPLIADLVNRSSSSSSSGQDAYLPKFAAYFFSSLSRISSRDYVPTELDVLHVTTSLSSSTTGGIEKAEVVEGNLTVELLEIGGLTGKRGKWMHLFEDARFIVFVVDLDQCNDTENMGDTMQLLKSIVDSRWFAGASIILLLNVNMSVHSHPQDSGHDRIRQAAQNVLTHFQGLNPDRLFVSPCNIMANSGAAIDIILSATKEAVVTGMLREADILL